MTYTPQLTTGEAMETWIGSTEERLILSWGIPTNIYFSDNTKFITFTRSSTSYSTHTIPPILPCNDQVFPYDCSPKTTTSKNTYYCDKTFQVVNGIVTRWSYRGNNC